MRIFLELLNLTLRVLDPVNFYLSFSLYAYGQVFILFSLLCMSLDYILDRLSDLFRFNNYPLYEKAYIMFHIAGLSLRDPSERYNVTMASRESVRRWFHRFSKISL